MKLRKHRKSRKRKSIRKSIRKSRKRKSRGGRRKSRRSRKKRGAGPRANRAAKARHKEQQRLRNIHLTQCKTGKKKRRFLFSILGNYFLSKSGNIFYFLIWKS